LLSTSGLTATSAPMIYIIWPPSSMLYRGADIIRDVEWVIFDEVHYINDQEVRHPYKGKRHGDVMVCLTRCVQYCFVGGGGGSAASSGKRLS